MKLPDVRDRLDRALDMAGTHDRNDLAEALMAGEAKLWVNRDAVLITEIVEYPKTRHCQIWLAAGLLDDVLGCWDEIRAHAEQEGCSKVVVLGRRGWKKSLQKLGWVETMTRFEKEL